jgi:predicted nucleotidyltransferase
VTAPQVTLQPDECEIVAAILRKHVPGRAVWAFGSRATGKRVKRFSDLDLAVEGRLTAAESCGLADDFDESLLPIKVDVVELDGMSEEFRRRVEKDFVLVQKA